MTRGGGSAERSRDVKATSVILHNHIYPQWLTLKDDADGLGSRMSHNIRERRWRDAVQSCLHRGWQPARAQSLCMAVPANPITLSVIPAITGQCQSQT